MQEILSQEYIQNVFLYIVTAILIPFVGILATAVIKSHIQKTRDIEESVKENRLDYNKKINFLREKVGQLRVDLENLKGEHHVNHNRKG